MISGLSQEDLLSQSRRLIEDAYPIGILDLYSSASPFSCLPLSNKNPALNSKGSGTSLLLSCSETNTTPMYSPQKNIAEVARDHILPVLRIPGLSENLSDLKGEKEHAENLIALPARSMILERLDSQVRLSINICLWVYLGNYLEFPPYYRFLAKKDLSHRSTASRNQEFYWGKRS